MKRLLCGGRRRSCWGWSAQANAADLGRRPYAPPAPVYAPVYSWTGLYLGVNGGGGWGNSTWTGQSPSFDTVGRPVRRHGRLQLAVRPDRGRPRRRLAVVGHQGQRRLRVWLRNPQQLVRHRARPSRLRLGSLHALRDRRSRLRQHRSQSDVRRLCRTTRPMPAGRLVPVSSSRSRRTGPRRSNISTSISAISPAPPAHRRRPTVDFNANIVRGGINYRF